MQEIPFLRYTGGVIVIEGKLKGYQNTLHFILDTGSGGFSLDSATCADLNIKTTPTDTVVQGIAGAKKVNFIFNQTFYTGNLATPGLNIYVNDYSILSSVYGQKIDGIYNRKFQTSVFLNPNVLKNKYIKKRFKVDLNGF